MFPSELCRRHSKFQNHEGSFIRGVIQAVRRWRLGQGRHAICFPLNQSLPSRLRDRAPLLFFSFYEQ